VIKNLLSTPDMQQTLYEDDAHLLKSRGVIKLEGKSAPAALQPLITNSLETVGERSVLAYILTDTGKLLADMFVISREQGLLLDCTRSQIPMLLELLMPQCEMFDVTATDVSAQWRVFGILPSQSIFNDATTMIKYLDPRYHMGTRVLRPRTAEESSDWNHENKWIGHCFRLGMLASAELVQSISVCPLEANLHMLDVLHKDCLGKSMKALLDGPRDQINRRVLPIRVEPKAKSFPTMTGLPVLAEDAEIATVLGHVGVFGLVLTDISKWRTALASAQVLRCVGESVTIAWPTWCANESQGRRGPIARGK
jgi:hypothetical protein